MNEYNKATCNDLISHLDDLKKDMDNSSDLYDITVNLVAILNAIKFGNNSTKDPSILSHIFNIYRILEKVHSKSNTNEDETMSHEEISNEAVKNTAFTQACMDLIKKYEDLSKKACRYSIIEVQEKCHMNIKALNIMRLQINDWDWDMYREIELAYDTISNELYKEIYKEKDESSDNELKDYTNEGDETMSHKKIYDDLAKDRLMFIQACVNLLQRYKNLSEAAGRYSITEVQAKCYQNMSVLNTIMYDNNDWNWEMYNIIYKAYDSISKEFMIRSYEKNDEYFNNELRNYVNEKKDEELNNKMHEKKNEYAGNKLYNYTKEYTYQKYNIDVTNKIIEEHRNKRKEYKKQMFMYKKDTVEYEYYNTLQTFEKFFINYNARIIYQNSYTYDSLAKKNKKPGDRYFNGSEYKEIITDTFQKMLCIMHTLENTTDEDIKTTTVKILDEHINLVIAYLKHVGVIKEDDKE